MTGGQVQIFISYATNDNVARVLGGNNADAPKTKGFVDFLHEQLLVELRDQGYPDAKIWRDPNIGASDPFGPIIREAIAESAILVVIMSRNWLRSDYCRDELDLFVDRWKDDPNLERRLVVVSKHHVESGMWPSALQVQRGIKFFSRENVSENGLEADFYARGEVQDRRYWDVLKDLAHTLGLRSERFGATPRAARTRTVLAAPRSNGRVVYVAKPANDMRRAYDRVVKELTGRGFSVVPDPHADLPHESADAAYAVISQSLQAAEMSIHLLGDSHGFSHDGGQGPIADVQLRKARAKVPPFQDSGDTRLGFHRIIWAPRLPDDGVDLQEVARDPIAVLEAFDSFVPADCVEGDTLSKLVDFLDKHLVRAVPPKEAPQARIEAQSKVYIYHPREDEEYAFQVAKVFNQRQIATLLPAFDDSETAQSQLHRQYLRDCDSVVLCWAAGSEVWAKTNTHALQDWQTLGRARSFQRRAAVAGPPPGVKKRKFVELTQKNEIDVIVDLTGHTEPTIENLKPLFDAS